MRAWRPKAQSGNKLEHLARYISRPPIATERLALTDGGNIRYALKTPYRDGTTHVIFEPMDFIARLAALVPKPRAHLTRYHGVFAPNSRLRAHITPGARGKRGLRRCREAQAAQQPASQRRASMTWAERLKRVFRIEIEVCRRCGGRLRVIASIEDPAVIERILNHLGPSAESPAPAHPTRAPPQRELSI